MEEIDEFIKEQCKILECTFANDECIEFNPPQNIELLVRCIWKIDESSKNSILSYKYPRHIVERLHLATKIAEYLEVFKIHGDIGFHNILYGSYNSLRYILLDTIRKIPIILEIDESDHSNSILSIASGAFINEEKWIPEFCRNITVSNEDISWFRQENSPELLPFYCKASSNRQNDPRWWIVNFCNEEYSFDIRPPKPALPRKPNLYKNEVKHVSEDVQQSEHQNEPEGLSAKFSEVRNRYNKKHQELMQLIEETAELERKINKFDPRLIEALSNPSHYVPMILDKTEKLHQKTEKHTAQNLILRNEALREIDELKNQLKINGIEVSDKLKNEQISMELAEIKEKHEHEKNVAEKLKRKINQANDFCFETLEKRCRDMEDMIRRQRQEVQRVKGEKDDIRKKVQREIEVFDRSFGVVTEYLKQSCENSGRKAALEAFLKIHISCLEVLDDIEKTAQNKIDIQQLKEEIERECLNNYEEKKEMIEQDISDIVKENDEILKSILLKNPHFQL